MCNIYDPGKNIILYYLGGDTTPIYKQTTSVNDIVDLTNYNTLNNLRCNIVQRNNDNVNGITINNYVMSLRMTQI